MGKIFYIMGKSSSGKDTVYAEILSSPELELCPVVMYTTRPIRARETDGVEYHFVTEEIMEEMERAGKIIELRTYQTVFGPWYYFTADTEAIDLSCHNYLALGTLESYGKVKKYYGEECVVPVYIEVEDGLRLERALMRERKQAAPNYDEVCRRFLADQKDFAEENIQRAGILRRFSNDGPKEDCISEVAEYIRRQI